jgi:signal peptidase II
MTSAHGSQWRAVPLGLAAAVVLVDQLTKWWALRRLPDGAIEVIWTLQFRLTFNSGMAFGTGQGWGPVIAIAAFVVVIALARSLWHQRSPLSAAAIGCLVGGATGNLLDRLAREPGLFRGSVVDFIDFGWFPVFNVADIAINVGAALLVLTMVSEGRRERGTSK